MKSGNLVFTYQSGNQSALPVGFRETDETEEVDQRPYIYCYPPPDGLQAKVVSPHLINLEAMRTLELELSSGRNDIKAGTVRIRPATAGLRLRSTEVEVVEGELEVSTNGDTGVIEFTRFPPKSFVRLRMPYTVEEAFTTLSARAEIGYETEHGKFAFSTAHDIIATLPISVNVQDVFKDEVLFSRFTVSPAMLIPLRITNCSLPSSESYEVQSSITGPVALDVFPKQPASLLYKIRPSPTPKSASRSLRLRVDFTCIDDECFDAIEKLFVAAVESSPFAQYATLFTSHLIGSFRGQLSTGALEVIGLVREVETLSYRSVRWDDLLGALKDRTEEMRQWLTAWHEVGPSPMTIILLLIHILTSFDTEQSGRPPSPTTHYPHPQHYHPCGNSRNSSGAYGRVAASSQLRSDGIRCISRRCGPDDLRRADPSPYAALVLPSSPGERWPTARVFVRATR